MRARPLVVFDRLDLWEWRFCQRVTHLSLYRPWRLTLKTASKVRRLAGVGTADCCPALAST